MGNQVQPDGRRVFDDIYTFPQDSQDLADDIFAYGNVILGTSAERQALPSSRQKPGMLWSETDTGALYRTNGSSWSILSMPLTSWTPTITGLAVGNGSLVTEFNRVGDLVNIFVEYTHGSTSSVSGQVSFTPPVGFASPTIPRHFGVGLLRIQSTSGQYPFQGRFTGGSNFNFAIPTIAGSAVGIGTAISNTFPTSGAWGSGSTIYFQGTYKAAA